MSEISASDESLGVGERPRGGRWSLGAAALVVVGAGAAAGWYVHSLRRPETIAGLKAGGEVVGGVPFAELDGRLHGIAERFLDGTVAFRFGEERVRAPRREVGFVVDGGLLAEQARAAGKSGEPLADLKARGRARRGELDLGIPATIDRAKATEFLTEVKETLDRAALDAKLDLDRHAIAEERSGRLLSVYASLGVLEAAAALPGPGPIELVAAATPARVKKEDLGGIDISTVLGAWETHYSAQATDSDRTYNLKVGAEHLNGHILKPHELFSFNEVVGDRTEKEGYRVAPVISGGELIDGIAGGMCQIASTLHAAAFFAGLEIVSSTPHSRPSAYIPMGLDATVVYPTTDLKLRNPFDFPIVMHYQVHQGTVKVELLGKARPYKVVFEREILEEHGFGEQPRADPEAPKGQRIVLQEGYPGYRAIRRRYVFDGGAKLPRFLGPATEPITTALARAKLEPVATQKWAVSYPSTTLLTAVGSGPPTLAKKPQPPSHHIPAIPVGDKPIFRVAR